MNFRRSAPLPALLALALLTGPASIPAAADAVDGRVKAACARIAAAQKELKTARAKCVLNTMLSVLNMTSVEEGTVAWKRMPDGSIRQRWDFSYADEDGAPHRSAIHVLGDSIVYLKDGAVSERGPLRAPDLFHHPALGGLVVAVPQGDELKDPEFRITMGDDDDVHHGPEGVDDANEAAEDGGGKPAAPAPKPPAADRNGSILILYPRKAPWKDLLETIVVVFDRSLRFVVQADYRENNNNQYSVRFSDFEINPALDDRYFDLPVAESGASGDPNR